MVAEVIIFAMVIKISDQGSISVHVVLVARILASNVIVCHPVGVHDSAETFRPGESRLCRLSTSLLQWPSEFATKLDLRDATVSFLLL